MTPRTCTPEEAAAALFPTDTLGFGLGPGIPDGFLRALGGRNDWVDLVAGGALLLDYYTVFTQPGVSYRCGFFGPAERILHAEGHRVELPAQGPGVVRVVPQPAGRRAGRRSPAGRRYPADFL